MAFTRNYFWRTHHKSPYTRTSYSSVRSPYSSSLTKYNNNGRIGRNPSCVRYHCNDPNNVALRCKTNRKEEIGIQPKQSSAMLSNDRLQLYTGSDLNRFGKVRSISDSGIALRNFTPDFQSVEDEHKSVSV